jgi:hypothetical protein
MRRQIVSVKSLLFSLLTSALAATYVVDQRAPNAADTNPGTREAPFKTIGEACEIARAGDTVLIRPGIYRESLIPRNSGGPGNPIIFRGEPMARARHYHNRAGVQMAGDHWIVEDCVMNWMNAGYFYEISWDGVMRDNVAFGIRGAGHGNYGAGSVISDSSNTVSERNVFIGGDGGASILSGSRSGEGRTGRTSRDNRVIETSPETQLLWGHPLTRLAKRGVPAPVAQEQVRSDRAG